MVMMRRRGMMELPSSAPVPTLAFETVTGATFLNRYNQSNAPVYADINGNHIDWNTNEQSSGVWYWTGNISCYNSNNKQWLHIPAGSAVTLAVTFSRANNNMRIYLRDMSNDTMFNNIVGCQATSAGRSSNTVTVANDSYCYVGYAFTPNGVQWSIDVEIYIDGVRVL